MSTPTGTPVTSPRNGLGLAGMICGIVGVVFGVIPITFWIAAILGILAVIFGLTGRARVKKGEADNGKQAATGWITGIVACALAVVGLVIVVTAVNDFNHDVNCIGASPAYKAAHNCDPNSY